MAGTQLLETPLVEPGIREHERPDDTNGAGRDRWGWFVLLMGSMTVWQLCFIATNTFIGVYLIREFGVGERATSLPLALLPAAGAAGTLLGGWSADRIGRLTIVRLGYGAALAGAVAIAAAPSPLVAVAGTCAVGAGIFLPFAPHITLSHSYLPRRIGAASGISIGVTSALGGLISAALGQLADAAGLRIVFVVLGAALVVGVIIGFLLCDPDRAARVQAAPAGTVALADIEP